MTTTIYDIKQPCIAGSPYVFPAFLFQRANSLLIQTSPAIAAGDVQISKDGGGYVNIANLPVEVGATGELTTTLTALETTGAIKYISVKFSDAAGAQWADAIYIIEMNEAKVLNFMTLGPGSISWPITIKTPGGIPLDGVNVWISTDAAGANVIFNGYTDAFGIVSPMLDPGTYYSWKQLSGYNFTLPEAFTVT